MPDWGLNMSIGSHSRNLHFWQTNRDNFSRRIIRSDAIHTDFNLPIQCQECVVTLSYKVLCRTVHAPTLLKQVQCFFGYKAWKHEPWSFNSTNKGLCLKRSLNRYLSISVSLSCSVCAHRGSPSSRMLWNVWPMVYGTSSAVSAGSVCPLRRWCSSSRGSATSTTTCALQLKRMWPSWWRWSISKISSLKGEWLVQPLIDCVNIFASGLSLLFHLGLFTLLGLFSQFGLFFHVMTMFSHSTIVFIAVIC